MVWIRGSALRQWMGTLLALLLPAAPVIPVSAPAASETVQCAAHHHGGDSDSNPPNPGHCVSFCCVLGAVPLGSAGAPGLVARISTIFLPAPSRPTAVRASARLLPFATAPPIAA